MPADSSFIYGPDDYFAFVESNDPCPPEMLRDALTEPIRKERDHLDLPKPNRLVWVDCIEARYFMQLGWRDELCHIGRASESAKRRGELRRLERSKFLVGLLLLDARGDAEGGTAAELTRAGWHRVAFSPSEGIPVLVGPDFDLAPDATNLRRLRYLGRCSDLERKSLANAFSLDFLPTARIGDRERDDPQTPPRKPKPSTGSAKPFIVIELPQDQPVYAPPPMVGAQGTRGTYDT